MNAAKMVAAVAMIVGVTMGVSAFADEGETPEAPKIQQDFALSPSGRAIRVGGSGWLLCDVLADESNKVLTMAVDFKNATVEVVPSLAPEDIRIWVPRDGPWKGGMLVHLFSKLQLWVHCEDEAVALRRSLKKLATEIGGLLEDYPRHSDEERAAWSLNDLGAIFYTSNSGDVVAYNEATHELYIDCFVAPGHPGAPTIGRALGREEVPKRQYIVVRVHSVMVRVSEEADASEEVRVRAAPIVVDGNQRRATRLVILTHCEGELPLWEAALRDLVNGGGVATDRPNIRKMNTKLLIRWRGHGEPR